MMQIFQQLEIKSAVYHTR